jgi:hypothetical protein
MGTGPTSVQSSGSLADPKSPLRTALEPLNRALVEAMVAVRVR